MATRKLALSMAASALMPARINSVFLMGADSLAPRSFKSSRTANSALGNVKLSRTILTFLIFAGFSAAALLLAAGTFLAATFLLAVDWVEGTGFAVEAALVLAKTFAGCFAVTTVATLAAGFIGETGGADLRLAGAAGALVVCIHNFLLKRYIQFISFNLSEIVH